MGGPDTVNPPEPLDEADRVPVQVVVQDPGAVLEVLPLRDDVGGDEHPDVVSLKVLVLSQVCPGSEPPDYARRGVPVISAQPSDGPVLLSLG